MSQPLLYDYFRSSACYRVRIALNLKGVAYQAVPTSLLAGDQKSEAYRAINPQGFVPALVVDDGVVLTQSLAIIDWLDHRYAEPRLIPAEPLERARALALTMMIAADIHPINNLRILKYLGNDLGLREVTRDNWYRHWIVEGFNALEAMVDRADGASPFLGGDAPGIADVFLVPQMYNARRFEVDLTPYPRLVAADAAARELAPFAAAAPDMVKPEGV